MRFLGLDLPPLTLIMLLAFLWLVLLVLLLWSGLRPRRPLEPSEPSQPKDSDWQRARRERDVPVQLPRPQIVREVRTEARPQSGPEAESEGDDPFDSYKPNSRRDDFDF